MTVSQSLFKGQKVIFPSNMRLEMTNIIHDSIFQGWNQAACAVPATYCFGRGMNKAVTNYSLACPLCELYRHANTKEPLLLYEVHARTYQPDSSHLIQLISHCSSMLPVLTSKQTTKPI